MDLIPTIISLCGFGIAITYVLICRKFINSADETVKPAANRKVESAADQSQTVFIRKHAAAH